MITADSCLLLACTEIIRKSRAAPTQPCFFAFKRLFHESAEEKYRQTGQNDLQAIQLHAKHSLPNASSI
jgi:hypothetical protein